MVPFNTIRLIILDIDGVIYFNERAVDGASEAIETMRNCGFVVRFLTNDVVSSRESRADELRQLGFEVTPSDIYTPASLTANYLREIGSPRTMLFLEGESEKEFHNIPIVDYDPEIVVVGDCFSSFNFAKLNRAFLSILNGARFIALQKNRYWPTSSGPTIDSGFWVAGLEYCTGIDAEIIGKPSPESYLAVCREEGIDAKDTIMVSDDAAYDLLGAKKAGLMTVHVTDYCITPKVEPPLFPDLVVPNLLELVKIIGKM